MDEYLKLKIECCEQQKQKWMKLIKKMEGEGKPQHLINYRLEGMKDDLFEYYYKLMKSLDKIQDLYFVNSEYSKMFEKMVELVEFNGNVQSDPNNIKYFQVRRNNVIIATAPSVTMALMGPGNITENSLINFETTNESTLNNVTKLYFGKNVSGILPSTCRSMKKLRNVYFHPETKCDIIDDFAFEKCSSLKEIIIPNKVNSIGYGCFAICGALSRVIIGKKVEKIWHAAFIDCDKLNYIDIPDSVKFIGDEVFKITNDYSSNGLVEITGMKNVEELGHSVFMGTAITEVRLGPKLKKIGHTCFMGIPLKTLTLEYNKDLEIEFDAFNNLNELTIINLIGGNAKKWVEKLKRQFMNCWKIHMLSERYQEQIEQIRIRNDFKWDVSDEVIYIAYARNLEQVAGKLMIGGETNVQVPTDVTRYISGFNPKRK